MTYLIYREPVLMTCHKCGHKGDSPRDFAWYPHIGGYLCLNKSSCIWRRNRR